MEREEVVEAFTRLADEMDRQRRLVQDAYDELERIVPVVQSYLASYPYLAEVVDEGRLGAALLYVGIPERPKGVEALLLLLHENPDHPMTVGTITEVLRDRGWLPESDNPANAVRTALERLVADPEESNVYKGRDPETNKVTYAYRPDGPDSPYVTLFRSLAKGAKS